MSTSSIEPGLLKVFRWYVGTRLGVSVLVLAAVNSERNAGDPRFPEAGVFFFGILMVLLVWPWAQRKLGRWFLPVALALATLGPIVESANNIIGRLDAGLGPNDALADYWQPFFLLWVPLLMIAWQYRFRAVIFFAAVTTVLDLGLAVPPLEEAGADITILSGLVVARGMLFAFVGLFVVKLVGGQKEARRRLEKHAVTLEELAISRERNRLARELHDTLAHSLSAVAVQLEAVKSVWEAEPVMARELLDQSLVGAREGLGEARRAIQALRASPLEEKGLAGALVELASSVEARSSLSVDITLEDHLGDLDSGIEQAVYRIASEALTNATRHSQASKVTVMLDRRGRRLSLEVRDDGMGFDTSSEAPNGHIGLRGMRERAAMAGGTLVVNSTAGKGTIVRFEVEAPR